MEELVTQAVIFAAQAHNGMQRRQENTPYILHPAEVAAIVGSITDKQEVIAAALLHDVVEDAGVPMEEIRTRFGNRVAELVASETENKRDGIPAEETWKIRKQEGLQIVAETKDRDIKILYLGDKLANIRSLYCQWRRKGHAIWQNFNQKDPREQAWLFRGMAENLKELSDTPAWQEFHRLIEIIFEEV